MYEALLRRRQENVDWRKIPWNEPDFSRRMLREHLSQEHDRASRRLPVIDQSVKWIHESVLGGRPSSILDLGCGPGFYTHRLTQLSHRCKGMDFSPASNEYAQSHHLGEFILADVVTADYGSGYDLVCMIYGELNAFDPKDAQRIIEKAYVALLPGGCLLLEVSSESSVRKLGEQPNTWYTEDSGLFSDSAHLVLHESYLNGPRSESWYFVIDIATGSLSSYVAMHQIYTDADYRKMLSQFSDVQVYPNLTGKPEPDPDFVVWIAKK